VNVAIPTVAQRIAADPLTPNDPDLLAGQTDVDAPDGPNDEVNTGYLWDSALRAGLTVRNYGFLWIPPAIARPHAPFHLRTTRRQPAPSLRPPQVFPLSLTDQYFPASTTISGLLPLHGVGA